MKFPITVLFAVSAIFCQGQKVLPLYSGPPPGSEDWTWTEAEMYSEAWQTRVIYNVAVPTLTAYLPPPALANGTAAVVCPGGAFHALSIDSEGIDVARWLASKGVAAFVLKYRLVKSETTDPVQELSLKMADANRFDQDNFRLIPLAVQDGLQALKYLRTHASTFNINSNRIGIIGFSAGGTVAAGVAFQGEGETRPDFVAPIYAYVPPFMQKRDLPVEAPPAFIAAASDDQLGLAPHSILLYNKWITAGRSAELHLYASGGHGFGMRTQHYPSDTWIDRLGDWMEAQGLYQPSDPDHYLSRFTPQQIRQRRNEADEKFRSDWANLEYYREENRKIGPPRPGENRVVFMGNSITAGWIRSHPEFFAGKPYVNRGIGGQTTPQMLVRFKQDVVDLKPKVVVILAGINDIAGNTGPTTPEAILDNISGMALLAKAHGIRVILCSVLPAYDFPWRPGLDPAGKVVALNKMIKAFADNQSMYYVDYFHAMVDARKGMKTEYATDEVHPTLAGYKVMEPLVEEAIETALKKK